MNDAVRALARSRSEHICWDCDEPFLCGQQYSSCPENADPETARAEDYEASKISRYYDGVAE